MNRIRFLMTGDTWVRAMIHANEISRWVREAQVDKTQAFPGCGQKTIGYLA